MYFIRPYQAYYFRCGFSNNSVLASVVTVLSQDIVFLRSLHSILTFVPEALWCSSFQPIISFCQRSCSFHAYPFNRSVVSSFQVSSHLVKFNSFHLQAECCPNYITLIPSLSCLTGVLCPFVQVLFALSSLASLSQPECRVFIWAISSYQILTPFSTGVLSEIFVTPCSIHSIVPVAVCCDFIKYLLILSRPYSILFFPTGVLPEFGLSWSPSVTGVFSIYIFPSTSRFRNALCP